MTEKKPQVRVPSMVELAKKKASIEQRNAQKSAKKKSSIAMIAVAAFVLVIIIALAVFFLVPQYKYSFNINGVDFVSNEYTPSEFFKDFKDSNSFLVTVDLKENENNAWVVNSMNLWIVALNADHKNVASLVRVVDSSNSVIKCSTNDGNILSSIDLNASACNSLFNDTQKSKVVIILGGENKAIISKNTLKIISKSESTISQVNYYVIKQMYANFDKVLAAVNDRINAIK